MRNCVTFSFVAALLFLFSCGSCQKESENNRNKTTITIGISQEPDSLMLPFKEMLASEEVVRVGNYTLTCFDSSWNLVPWAAKEIPTFENGLLELYFENGQKKMKTTWHLKESFFWPDGTPLTADDFIFTNKIYQDRNQEIISRVVSDKVEKMASKDNGKTLVVYWKEPYAYYHNYAQHEALPKHLVAPIYNQNPDKLKESQFAQRPALAGAFTIKDWVAGSHIVAQKNGNIKPPFSSKLQEVIWRIIPQTNTLESNLVSGNIDAISPAGGISLNQALDFEKRYKDQFNFYYTEGLVWEHIDFNLDNPIFSDVRVRRALVHALDREGISQKLFLGKQPVAHGTEPPRSPYHSFNIKKYDFNPSEANKLLDAAGWRMNKDGYRYKNNQPLRFSIMTTSGNKTREQVQQLLQSQWKDIGADVSIKNQPAKVFFGNTVRKRKFDGMVMYSWVKDPVQLSDTLWRKDYIPTKKNNYQGQNMPGWKNDEVHKLLVDAASEMDDKKRIAMGKRVEEIFSQELPAIPLYFRVDVSVTKKGLQNWKPTGTLQPITWNAQEWYWN